MGNTGKGAGHSSPIKREFWPEMQRLDRAGAKLHEITAWLLEQGVQVGKSSVHRALERIRAEAPLPEVPKAPIVLEPQTDEDELKNLRAFAHEEMDGGDWKQRHSAARLLLAVRAELRANKPAPSEQPAAAPSATTVASPIFGVKSSASA